MMNQLLSLALMVGTVAGTCPPVAPLDGLDIVEYTRATWYIQQQQVNAYQTLDDLYCVLATYDADGDYSVPAFKGPVVGVFNYANTGEVNGPSQSANGTVLCAREVNITRPAQLAVAPCFLPNIAAGPYWVLAVGYESEAMTWAVVSGGQPTVELDDGCTTSTDSINGSGLWIFSRSQVMSDDDMQAARQALVNLGFSLDELVVVAQEGCTYAGALLKN